jgi:hypothetical protein
MTENPRVGGSNPPLGTKIRDFLVSLDTTTRTNVPDQLAELA